ncbi:MAG: penicillin-binding protein activator [Proteobacteria bacterium]|nr:penicillin-binding protein activator [Pseudomonadota bacterium]
MIKFSKALRLGAFVLLAPVLAACIETSGVGQRVNPNQTVKVALLVPTGSGSGQQEALATSLINAAKLAASDIQGAKIELMVYSTAGNSAQAAKVAKLAVEEGAKIIVGPLFAEAANAAGVAVAGRNVNVLSLSNNTQIAGGNVFVLGNTFDNTASRLVRYAASKGLINVAAVAAKNTAGEIAIKAVQKAADNSGTNFTGSTSYDFTPDGVVGAVSAIKTQVTNTGTQALVFSSDSAGALPILAQLLPENGLGPDAVQYMGLTRWDIPASTLVTSGLQGGWFTLPDTSTITAFRSRYAAAYGANPHSLAGFAYDGIAAIGALLATGDPDALTRSKLTRTDGFAGVNGVFRLLPDGTNQRGLAIAEVRNGEAVVIDPAPRGFGGSGS